MSAEWAAASPERVDAMKERTKRLSKELADSYSRELADSYVDETPEARDVDETPER